MGRRKIKDEVEARWCLLEAKRGGLSAGEWSRAHGVDGRSLHAWQLALDRRGAGPRTRARKRKGAPSPHAVVELVPAAAGHNGGTSARYVLEVAGTRLEFGDDVSVVTLRRVLEVLRSC